MLALCGVHWSRPIVTSDEVSCQLGAVLPLVMAGSNAALDPAGVGAPGSRVLGRCKEDWGR